jgi:hypothetical protein
MSVRTWWRVIGPPKAFAVPLRCDASVTITGVLNYQACDDKACFMPQSVPLTWTVNVRSLDRERAKH